VDFRRKQLNIVPCEMAEPASASAHAEQSMLRAQIQQALAVLPEDHRSALLLREFGGLSYAEVAAALGASHEQVKVWIFRARKKLAEVLDRDGQYVGEKRNGA
jgi:RNA polymerase sigma-70 factor (ECF subfamily)